MDLPLEKIKNILKQKVPGGPSAIDPHKHWIRILEVFSAIVIVLIIFSFFLLLKIKNDSVFQVAPTLKEDNSAINESLLKSVSNTFDQKKIKEDSLKSSLLLYTDPSL